MSSWVLTFFIIAIAAALLAFTGMDGTLAQIAPVVFVVFLFLLGMSLAVGTVLG